MSIRELCFDIIDSLIENIRPKVEFCVNFNSDCSSDDNELALICLLQFFEELRHHNYSVQLVDNLLCDKLSQLSDQIMITYSGEISPMFQTYLRDRVENIRQLLVQKTNLLILIDDLIPGELPRPSTSILNDNLVQVESYVLHPPSLVPEDPFYEKLAGLLLKTVSIENCNRDYIQEMDDVLDYLCVKNPERCKITLINRLRRIQQAVNAVTGSDSNVNYDRYLRFHLEEIYNSLKNDTLYDKSGSFFIECKVIFLERVRHIRLVSKESFLRLINFFKMSFNGLKNFCAECFIMCADELREHLEVMCHRICLSSTCSTSILSNFMLLLGTIVIFC